MKANNRIITNADNTNAIFIEKNACGYRLKKAERNLAGEWCNSFTTIEASLYRTIKVAAARATEILAQA